MPAVTVAPVVRDAASDETPVAAAQAKKVELMELRMVANESAWAMAAAFRLLAGEPLPDEALAAALAPGVQELAELLALAKVPPARAANHLIPQAACIGSNIELAHVLKRKLGIPPGSAAFHNGLVRAISAIEAAVLRTRPELTKELAEEAQRLEQAWLAYGGQRLLDVCARLTDPLMIAPAATVLMGTGLGVSHALLPYNAVFFAPLPCDDGGRWHTAVLAYLLAQLQVDLPVYADRLLRSGPQRVASLALVPVILTALAEVAPPQQSLVPSAAPPAGLGLVEALATGVTETTIALWLTASGREADAACYAAPLAAWWAAYREGGNWPIALAALDRLIADARVPATTP